MYLWCERRRVSGSWGTSREETLGQRRNTPALRFYQLVDLLPPMCQVPRWHWQYLFSPRCQVGWAGNLETSACFAQESQRNIWTGPMARPGLTQVLYQRTSCALHRGPDKWPYPPHPIMSLHFCILFQEGPTFSTTGREVWPFPQHSTSPPISQLSLSISKHSSYQTTQ